MRMTRGQIFVLTGLMLIGACTCIIVYVFLNTNHTMFNEEEFISKVVRTEQGSDGYVATHVRKGCTTRNLAQAVFHSQYREDYALLKNYFSFPKICNGVYVEIGALDGIRFSNTKFFEDYMNWTGVLIEASPVNAKELLVNRKSEHNKIFTEAVCREGQKHVRFIGGGPMAGIPEEIMLGGKRRYIMKPNTTIGTLVPCRPIGTMLREAGIKAIDFFIVDVEGAELTVLQTMDWSIPVKAFVVEMNRGKLDQLLVDLLYRHGYKKSIWSIRGFAVSPVNSAPNQVFEHQNYTY